MVAVAAPGALLAQGAYPIRPVQVIVPLQAGSAADVGNRVALGMDPERFLAALIGSAACSRVMETKGRMMAARRFAPLQSEVDQSLKDFRLILEQPWHPA